MIKVGVVGLGSMGCNHVRVYSQLGCKLVGVSDVDAARAREIGDRYGVPYYTDYTRLMPQVDAVSIAVPTSLHHRVAMDFIERGVHCLVEKPIASTLAEAEDMVEKAEANHVRLLIGHIERFNPAVLKLKQIIDQKILGQLMLISTRRVGPSVPRIRDVGIIVDTATHDIDVVRYLIGAEPVGTFCKSSRFSHEKEDCAIIVLDFGDAAACLEVNWFTPHKVRSLVVTGSEGVAYLDYIEQKLSVCNNGSAAKVIKVAKAEPLALELKHFLRCVEGNEEPLVNGHDGLRVLKIALLVSQSSLNKPCVPQSFAQIANV